MSIVEINRQVRAALTARSTDPQAIINDSMGPLWYRGLAISSAAARDGSSTETPKAAKDTAPIAPPVEDQLKSILSRYGARRIVIGHTPILSGIAMLFDERLIRIDTGISSVYGGNVSYLDIIDGTPVSHVVERLQPSNK
jgi:hypothetical protein